MSWPRTVVSGGKGLSHSHKTRGKRAPSPCGTRSPTAPTAPAFVRSFVRSKITRGAKKRGPRFFFSDYSRKKYFFKKALFLRGDHGARVGAVREEATVHDRLVLRDAAHVRLAQSLEDRRLGCFENGGDASFGGPTTGVLRISAVIGISEHCPKSKSANAKGSSRVQDERVRPTEFCWSLRVVETVSGEDDGKCPLSIETWFEGAGATGLRAVSLLRFSRDDARRFEERLSTHAPPPKARVESLEMTLQCFGELREREGGKQNAFSIVFLLNKGARPLCERAARECVTVHVQRLGVRRPRERAQLLHAKACVETRHTQHSRRFFATRYVFSRRKRAPSSSLFRTHQVFFSTRARARERRGSARPSSRSCASPATTPPSRSRPAKVPAMHTSETTDAGRTHDNALRLSLSLSLSLGREREREHEAQKGDGGSGGDLYRERTKK